MKLATAFSVNADSVLAITQAYQQVKNQLGGESPQFLVVHSSVNFDCSLMMSTLKTIAPSVPIHGGTSCVGVMTALGFHNGAGDDSEKSVGLLGILDPEGSYGVGVADLDTNPRAAAFAASQKALEQAKRPGEVPSIVWIMGPPGNEESLLKGIGDFFGPNVPIGGGSSGDNTVTGEWLQFANGEVYKNSIVVSVLFASKGIAFSFHSGYDPTGKKALVTKGEGRVIHQLNNRPAAEFYNEWIGGGITEELAHGGNILMKSSLFPLGRIVGLMGETPYYQLSHPDSVTADKSITMFSEVQLNDEVHLMQGSLESLIHRAERVVKSAIRTGDVDPEKIAGAIIIYCAGCMLTVKEQMPEVVESFRLGLGENIPFLGAFTFGEQGCFLGGENRHGNLMISVLIFRS
ncbi:MAG: FIST N-terminal domain-containing protein [Pseudobdellovibrio sp.]